MSAILLTSRRESRSRTQYAARRLSRAGEPRATALFAPRRKPRTPELGARNCEPRGAEPWTGKLERAAAALEDLILAGDAPRSVRDRATLARAWVATDETDACANASQSSELVIDRITHTVRIGALQLDLKSRWTLRSLLYAFVDRHDRHLTRDAITETLWSASYHPLRHDSSIKSNIRRLRILLADAGAAIECTPEGYQLVVRARKPQQTRLGLMSPAAAASTRSRLLSEPKIAPRKVATLPLTETSDDRITPSHLVFTAETCRGQNVSEVTFPGAPHLSSGTK